MPPLSFDFLEFQVHFLAKKPVAVIVWENDTNIPKDLSVVPLLKTTDKILIILTLKVPPGFETEPQVFIPSPAGNAWFPFILYLENSLIFLFTG